MLRQSAAGQRGRLLQCLLRITRHVTVVCADRQTWVFCAWLVGPMFGRADDSALWFSPKFPLAHEPVVSALVMP